MFPKGFSLLEVLIALLLLSLTLRVLMVSDSIGLTQTQNALYARAALQQLNNLQERVNLNLPLSQEEWTAWRQHNEAILPNARALVMATRVELMWGVGQPSDCVKPIRETTKCLQINISPSNGD